MPEKDTSACPQSREALRCIEGEDLAAALVVRLRTDQARPDEMAMTVAALYGGRLRGFCGHLQKVLRAQLAAGSVK